MYGEGEHSKIIYIIKINNIEKKFQKLHTMLIPVFSIIYDSKSRQERPTANYRSMQFHFVFGFFRAPPDRTDNPSMMWKTAGDWMIWNLRVKFPRFVCVCDNDRKYAQWTNKDTHQYENQSFIQSNIQMIYTPHTQPSTEQVFNKFLGSGSRTNDDDSDDKDEIMQLSNLC